MFDFCIDKQMFVLYNANRTDVPNVLSGKLIALCAADVTRQLLSQKEACYSSRNFLT